jgi:hypothetical protein
VKGAFVLRLGPESQSQKREFGGWIEEVDTGRDAKFHSTSELLDFLADCFELARRREREPPGGAKES